MNETRSSAPKGFRKEALQLIMLFGLVSLFGDIIYEGARSVNGQYLKTLGASAAIVGIVAGLGELLGYAIRLLSGYFADKTKSYWVLTFAGYGMLVSIPLLALTGYWQWAAFFMVMERLGKALRSPAKDTILSQAAKQVGTGFGFGLQEAMDQIGAICGPLIFTFLFIASRKSSNNISDYQHGFGLFWAPFALLMLCIFIAYRRIPHPEKLEESLAPKKEPDKLSNVFWLYTAFSFVTTLGLANFVLIAYHLKTNQILPDAQIPFFYAAAMAVDGAIALGIGKLYDYFKDKTNNPKAGLITLLSIPLLSIPIPILSFSRSYIAVICGILLWGVVMGIHETIMKSAIADLTPLRKRGTGYGIFNTSYGLAMFAGSAIMGLIYESFIPGIILLTVASEIAALWIFFRMRKAALSQA